MNGFVSRHVFSRGLDTDGAWWKLMCLDFVSWKYLFKDSLDPSLIVIKRRAHLHLFVLVSYSLLTDNMSLCLFRLSRGFHWIDSLSLQRSIQENKSDSGLELDVNFAIPSPRNVSFVGLASILLCPWSTIEFKRERDRSSFCHQWWADDTLSGIRYIRDQKKQHDAPLPLHHLYAPPFPPWNSYHC